ncbi:MAG TPA: membrane protein insertase YidC, partial [Ilumatobacteraceae bacterium]|nr:membrane protein insertase YidC [Ilumatobacteraceae bacterium]
MFEGPAWLVAQFYALTHDYAIAIGLIAVVVMALVTPLTLKSTKGMLEMQRLQPEMRRLQAQHRGDRQKLNEEMMKLYQEHKVNPLASCLPLLLQMPVFFIMYRILHGLANRGEDGTFLPKYISKSSELYQSLLGKTEMKSIGLDLSRTPAHFIGESFGKGIIYALLVVLLAALYYVQQKMVASRAAANPGMSATQAKIMQYLPVAFAVFQLFFLTGLVIYYIIQTLIRIGQNAYITRRFYHGDESLGRQAQAAGQRARDEAKANGQDK